MKAFDNLKEIETEWQNIKAQNIKKLEFNILALEGLTAIVNWQFEDYSAIYDGIYEIRFNENNECIYFRSWCEYEQKIFNY